MAAQVMRPFLRLDGDAGIVADVLIEAGQGVEQGGLAGVGIADQGGRATNAGGRSEGEVGLGALGEGRVMARGKPPRGRPRCGGG